MQKQNMPNPNTLVIVLVDKIEKYGAYCKLIEYDNVEAFMPLKEVSTGWIKNIHEFLHKGKTIVCRVIDVNPEKGTIDISLKKVTPKDQKEKISEYNLEKRISSLLAQAIKQAGLSHQKSTIIKSVIDDFGTYTNFHNNMIEKSQRYKTANIPEKLKETYIAVIDANRQKKDYDVSYTLDLVDYNTKGGITEIKNTLKLMSDAGVEVHYLGAPKYMLVSKGADYNSAEKKIKTAIDILNSKIKNADIEVKKNKTKNEKSSIMEKI